MTATGPWLTPNPVACERDHRNKYDADVAAVEGAA